MHFVRRGREPRRLKAIRARCTPHWVAFYEQGRGPRPRDARWTDDAFWAPLRAAFHSLCGYCERRCRGEVDHFKPKSRYPELVYTWSNWIFSCHDCNQLKGEKFPRQGYVNPCAATASNWPEAFFGFDFVTGEILPRAGLSRGARQKAQATIDDLGLNDHHQLLERLDWLEDLKDVLASKSPGDPKLRNVIQRVTARDAPLSSLTRAFLASRGLMVSSP